MVIALPNVIYAGREIVPELPPKFVTARPERLLSGLWAENRRACLAANLQAQESFMLWVDVEEQAIRHPQVLGRLGACRGKLQNRVSSIAVIIDQFVGVRDRTVGLVGGDRQPGHGVSDDVFALRRDFSPSDLAIAVGVEPNGEVEVTQRDVPLPDHALVL